MRTKSERIFLGFFPAWLRNSQNTFSGFLSIYHFYVQFHLNRWYLYNYTTFKNKFHTHVQTQTGSLAKDGSKLERETKKNLPKLLLRDLRDSHRRDWSKLAQTVFYWVSSRHHTPMDDFKSPNFGYHYLRHDLWYPTT